MPFVLMAIGVLFLVTAVRGTTGDLMTMVRGDFSGNGNFMYWALSIMGVGAVGYIKPLRPLSQLFLALVLITFILSNGGFFAKFMQGIANPSKVTPTPNSGAGGAGGSSGLPINPATGLPTVASAAAAAGVPQSVVNTIQQIYLNPPTFGGM